MELFHETRKKQSIVPLLDELKQKFNHQYRSTTAGEQAFSDTESQLVEAFMSAAAQALGIVMEAMDVSQPRLIHQGIPYTKSVRSWREYFTSAGKVKILRTLYRTHSRGASICPLDIKLGTICNSWTPKAAKVATHMVAEMTPYSAERLMREIGGLTPSKSSLDRLPKGIELTLGGNKNLIDENLRKDVPIPNDAVSMAISLDGVHIPIQKRKGNSQYVVDRSFGSTRGTLYKIEEDASPWREAGCGTISYFDKKGKLLQTRQYGRMPEEKKARLKTELRYHVEDVQKLRPDLKIVKVADGALDNWTFLDKLCPDAISVLDFYHAAGHLKIAMDEIFDDPNKAKETFERYRSTLRHNAKGIHSVIRFLSKHSNATPKNAVLRRELNYFKSNKARCEYHAVKTKHLPIGSGIVEAACKTLFTQRMKRSGMAWRWKGGQAVINFRTYLKTFYV